MSKFKVYITDFDYPDNEIEKRILEPVSAEVIGLQCPSGEGLLEQARDADALMVQYAKVYRETIMGMNNLKVIARYGIGMDIIDVDTAFEKGVVCTNVQDYCIDEVANHNLSLALMLIRRIPMFIKETKKGKWHWSETGLPVRRFRNLTVGLVAFGRIARNLAKKLIGLGFRVQTYDPYVSEDDTKAQGVEKVDFKFLISSSDVVCLQCPYTKDTHHMIGKKELKSMKPTSILINCARGKLVDNKALYKALSKGWIASAGMDDPEEEPAKKVDWTPSGNPLFNLDNCFITPHVAYYTEESLIEARTTAAEEVAAVLTGRMPKNRVR